MNRFSFFVTLTFQLGYHSLSFGQFTNNPLQLNTVTTAVPFLNISPDARAGGMGSTGGASSADANAIHWNTSKLAFSDKEAELSASYSPWLRTLLKGVNLLYFSGYKKIADRHTVTAAYRYFAGGNFTFLNPDGAFSVAPVSRDYEVVAGYAYKISDMFSVGINAKYISSTVTFLTAAGVPQSLTGDAGAVDLSLSFIKPDLTFGSLKTKLFSAFIVSNFGSKLSYENGMNSDFIPRNLRFANSLSTKFNDNNKLEAVCDFNTLIIPDFNNKSIVDYLLAVNISGGLEYAFKNVIFLRMGYFYETPSNGNRNYYTVGAGVNLHSIRFDISFLDSFSENNPLANTAQFSVNYSFDKKAE